MYLQSESYICQVTKIIKTIPRFQSIIMKRISFLMLTFSFFIYTKAQIFPDSQNDGKFYTVNGAKLWVVSFGSGDPLVIIPGGPGGNHYPYRAFDSLARTSTMVYFDA